MVGTGSAIKRDSAYPEVRRHVVAEWHFALYQAMNNFYDLLRLLDSFTDPDGSLAHAQQRIDDLFPAVAAKSPFRLWSPGDPIPAKGKRLLIGVATWSGLDMQFLDFLSRCLKGVPDSLTMDVFNVASCPSQEVL